MGVEGNRLAIASKRGQSPSYRFIYIPVVVLLYYVYSYIICVWVGGLCSYGVRAENIFLGRAQVGMFPAGWLVGKRGVLSSSPNSPHRYIHSPNRGGGGAYKFPTSGI